MPSRKLNCWEVMGCGREPGGTHTDDLGPCPAATERSCGGANCGQNAGRLCWAVGGTLCHGEVCGTHAQKIEDCKACPFFKRVKYEEGAHFQLLRPGLGATDPDALHQLLNNVSSLVGIGRDILACLAERPLLARITQHALTVTHAASACAYVLDESGQELVLSARAGSLSRPDRMDVAAGAPAAEAARGMGLYKGPCSLPGSSEPVSAIAIPIGGDGRAVGVLEVVKCDGNFSLDDEWFLWELSLIAALGVRNARAIEEMSQLRAFDKAKSKFVAILMHQVGSPLATIACSLQALLQLGDKLPAAQRQELARCSLERVESIQALSRTLLDLASIRSGSSLHAIRPVSPSDPMRQEIDDRLPQAREQGVEVAMNDRTGGALVLADPDGLRVLFGNLLDNAIKYSAGPGKRVEVELVTEEDAVCARVRDQGIGIPPEEQTKIFEELRRGSNAAGSEASGFGLGLAFVRELIDCYQGEIGIESAVGVGTTVTVKLPRQGTQTTESD